MSPERLLGSKYNIKSDVWSLAIIITELIFETPLWPSHNTAQVGYRLSITREKTTYI